ncbi:hypothetical protein BO70DRAFT_431802 [Aspergillus heteromorphus CBS 117.55]|uniref:Erythromycin esterase n=1 Tax=Aspergillus heteromorphus CBS 117.55 TaxID=1448321 RepID=A0A317VG69_9EURO|nr:uncharacterized protein BO70DRAFT_431802 [Aspergillus heteromorphus CBS 117.55]PWY72429.1 hypothetical protein BO70DRAFT_431802 [Aspergillus heteromorphus CBS 117.55]
MAVRRSARLRSRQSEEPEAPEPVVDNNNNTSATSDTSDTIDTIDTADNSDNLDRNMARLGNQGPKLAPVMERDEPAEDSERPKKRKSVKKLKKEPPAKKVAKDKAAEETAEAPKASAEAPPVRTEATKLPVAAKASAPAKTSTPSASIPPPTPKQSIFASTPKKNSVGTPLRATPRQPSPTKTPSSTLARPPHQEMHPSKVRQSTTKQADSGLILGFNPVKKDAEGNVVKDTVENTPTKAKTVPASPYYGTPAFEFKFACTDSLSDEAKKLMETVREDAAKIKAQMAQDQGQTAQERAEAVRKIVQPKGKTTRFSQAHMAEFKKMDSIEGHASAFRATPGRFQPVVKTLKRTNSKAHLDESDNASSSTTTPSKLARPSPAPATAPSNKRVKHDKADDASTRRPVEASPPKPVRRPRSTVRSSLMTPTRSSAARVSASVKPSRTSLIPSLIRSPASKPADIPRTPQTDFNPRLKSGLPTLGNLKSILRRHQPLFSKDPAKIASGTHVAAPDFGSNLLLSGTRDAPEEAVPTPSPKKRVEFTPCVKTRHEEALFSPSPSKIPTASPSRPTISDIVYPTLPVLTPEQSRAKSPGQATPTIRHVRPSDANINSPLPVVAGVPHGIGHKRTREAAEDTAAGPNLPHVAGMPHGIGHKKRNRAAVDETDAENVPPVESVSDGRSAKRMKMTSPSPVKSQTPAPAPTPSPTKTRPPTSVRPNYASPTKARSHTPLRSTFSSRKGTPTSTLAGTPGRTPASARSRGVLSMSRLNMLSQPKNRN